MSTVDEIKAAVAALPPEDQLGLFRWWVKSDSFRERQVAALKRDLKMGIEDLDHGRYRTYEEADAMKLAEEIGRSGRERLKEAGRNRTS